MSATLLGFGSTYDFITLSDIDVPWFKFLKSKTLFNLYPIQIELNGLDSKSKIIDLDLR